MLRLLPAAFITLFTLTIGCGPSINQAYKSEIERRVAGLRPGSTDYPASDAAEPMPLAVGQWIELKMVDSEHRPGFMTYKIVGQEGDAFWIETANLTYTGKHEVRMLVNFGDRKNLESVAVQSFKIRQDGDIQEYPPGLLGMMKSVWKPLVRSFIIQWTNLPQEDAKTPAGSFASCYKQRTTASFGPYEQTSDVWSHPAVPINGLVRSEGVDKPTSIELVAFGTAGAKSTF